MWMGMQREFRYLIQHKWDLCMVTLAPALIILLFSSMFSQGKPEHLAIAIIDQDQSSLSQNIIRFTELNHGLNVKAITTNVDEAEQLINQTKVWGYIHIPAGAEQRLVQAKDAQISIAYNQSYFSVGNSISSAMLLVGFSNNALAMSPFQASYQFAYNGKNLGSATRTLSQSGNNWKYVFV